MCGANEITMLCAEEPSDNVPLHLFHRVAAADRYLLASVAASWRFL